MTVDGITETVSVGEEGITEDFAVLEVKEDNTFTMSTMMGGSPVSGTWEEKDGKLVLTAEGQSIEATLDGDKLTMSMQTTGGASQAIVLVKK